jgi:hypothetical protein
MSTAEYTALLDESTAAPRARVSSTGIPFARWHLNALFSVTRAIHIFHSAAAEDLGANKRGRRTIGYQSRTLKRIQWEASNSARDLTNSQLFLA